MATLDDRDKERTRYHLGYLGVSLAASIQLGIPRPIQTVFLVEDAMQSLSSETVVSRVKCILDILDGLETQLRNATCSLTAERLGDLTLHPLRSKGILATDSIDKEYSRWASRLADVLGVPKYPYSERSRRGGPGGNIPVSG